MIDDNGDNTQMCTALFAGYETTSVTISRMLQFLASEDSRVSTSGASASLFACLFFSVAYVRLSAS